MGTGRTFQIRPGFKWGTRPAGLRSKMQERTMSSSNEALRALRRSEAAEVSDAGWPWIEDPGSPKSAFVEYVGRTALVVTGPYTGARYRFLQPGARVSVDTRDRQAMLSIPMLRPVPL